MTPMETSLTTWSFASGSRKPASFTSSTTVRRVSHFVFFLIAGSRVSACACHGSLYVRQAEGAGVSFATFSISGEAHLAAGLLATPTVCPGLLSSPKTLTPWKLQARKPLHDTQSQRQIKTKTFYLHPRKTTAHLSRNTCERIKANLITLHLGSYVSMDSNNWNKGSVRFKHDSCKHLNLKIVIQSSQFH